MKHLLFTLYVGLGCAIAAPLSANELVSNVKITSVEELMYAMNMQAVIVTYSGADRRCVSRNVQTITFQASTVDGINALNRISMTALTALETGSVVQIVGATAGNCYSANGIILGQVAQGN
jgi:hypothetical protein